MQTLSRMWNQASNRAPIRTRARASDMPFRRDWHSNSLVGGLLTSLVLSAASSFAPLTVRPALAEGSQVSAPRPITPQQTSVMELARQKRNWNEGELKRELDPIRRTELRVTSGFLPLPPREVRALEKLGAPGRLSRLRSAFAAHDLDEVERLIHAMSADGDSLPSPAEMDLRTNAEREFFFRWAFATEDFPTIERHCGRLEDATPTNFENLLARSEFAFLTIRVSLARRLFGEAVAWASTPRDRARALFGLARVEYNDRNFDAAEEKLLEALDLTPLFADAWYQYGLTMIRLGRTAEAVEAFEFATRVAPNHQDAHYSLGNGYALENYSQLFSRYPTQFLEASEADSDRASLAEADSLYRSGEVELASARYQLLDDTYPRQADLRARLGSVSFSQGHWKTAQELFRSALEIVPTYGRAQNGLAKSLEAERFAKNPGRQTEEQEFADTPMPQLPGIESYVINWNALSPRHQKRVALSVAPWGKFIPVLLAGGATHYIKPLHERLSESPGQETLTDARISYDSRLWDDVRGCGGHFTVTGIEDVERSVFGHYNTVLHELTHQIHGILPTDLVTRIDELYWETKARDERSRSAFLSRYAGGSVWEYFAEGANSAMTPSRAQFDTREITRKRLDEMDVPLKTLVFEIMEQTDIQRCFPMAFIARAEEELRSGDAPAALQNIDKALEYNQNELAALRLRSDVLLRQHQRESALQFARTSSEKFPEDGRLALVFAEALWFSGVPLQQVMIELQSRRPQVQEKDRPSLDSALGHYAWLAGDGDLALLSYNRSLAVQVDDPSGIWGRAAAHALIRQWGNAWSDYETAIRLRTGILDLRCDYARDLLRAHGYGAEGNSLETAKGQIDAALLLGPKSPRARTLLAWWNLLSGNPVEAELIAISCINDDPNLEIARLVMQRAHTEAETHDEMSHGETDTLVPGGDGFNFPQPSHPRYIFEAERGTYRQVRTQPFVEEELRQSWFPER